MAECKFTDEEIRNALELCIQNSFCECCEYRERTDKNDSCPIRSDALNLINKQNTEIEQLKRNLQQCENGYKQTIHLLKCQHKGEKEQIFALIWDAFQSTYYDSEFEEKFDKIEEKFTEGTQ